MKDSELKEAATAASVTTQKGATLDAFPDDNRLIHRKRVGDKEALCGFVRHGIRPSAGEHCQICLALEADLVGNSGYTSVVDGNEK